MCGIFCWQPAHTRGVSFEVPPFCLCSLLHVSPVLSRFRHFYVVHGLSYALARLLLMLTITLYGVVCNLLSHSLHRMTLGENSAGFTLRKKQFLDFSLLSVGCCPYREWASLVSCLVFSILAHTSLRMSGGNNKYSVHFHHTLASLTRYFPASLVAPLPKSEQINHPFSNHSYTSQCQITSITTMPPPPATPTHTRHTPSLQLHPHFYCHRHVIPIYFSMFLLINS